MDAPSLAPAPPPGVQPAAPAVTPPPPDQKQKPDKPEFADPAMSKDFAALDTRVAKDEAKIAATPYPHLDQPPPPQSKQTNPLETWGSAAMFLATIGSLMTRTPMTTALNSAAKVMDAVKQNDLATAKDEFDRWKVENENALKVAQFQLDDYRTTIEAAGADETRAVAMVNAKAAAHNDQNMLLVAQTNAKANIQRANADTMNAITNAKESAAKIAAEFLPVDIVTKGTQATLAWQNAKTPQEKEAAKGLLQEAHAASSWYSYVTGKGAAAAGAGGGKVTPAMVGMYETGMGITSILKGRGKDATTMTATLINLSTQDIMHKYPGMTETQAGMMLADKQITYAGGKKAITNLTNMEGATKQALDQLDINASAVSALMRQMPGTNISPILNGVVRGIQKWDGDPKYTEMFTFLQSSMAEFAKLRMGSQASSAGLTEGAAAEARKLADQDITPEAWDGFRQAAHYEGQKKLQTYKDAKRFMMPNGEMDFAPPKAYRKDDTFFGKDGTLYRVTDNAQHVEKVPLEGSGDPTGGGAEFDPSGMP